MSVAQNERGIASLEMADDSDVSADLFVDCSGFISLLLGKTLAEPFVSYRRSLFCERGQQIERVPQLSARSASWIDPSPETDKPPHHE